jgi:hypothetical protein
MAIANQNETPADLTEVSEDGIHLSQPTDISLGVQSCTFSHFPEPLQSIVTPVESIILLGFQSKDVRGRAPTASYKWGY